MNPSDPRDMPDVAPPPEPPRKPYVRPALKRLGSVRELSLAFSGGNQEGTKGKMKQAM